MTSRFYEIIEDAEKERKSVEIKPKIKQKQDIEYMVQDFNAFEKISLYVGLTGQLISTLYGLTVPLIEQIVQDPKLNIEQIAIGAFGYFMFRGFVHNAYKSYILRTKENE